MQNLYKTLIRFLLLTILSLLTALSVPIISAQPALSNPQSLLQQGMDSYQAENYAQAIKTWQQALQAWEIAADEPNQALILSNISLAYQHQGKLDAAENAVARSLNLLDNQATAPMQTLAKALNTKAHLKWQQGQPQAALETWQQAALHYAQAGKESGIIGCWINQAQALQTLGLHLKAEEKLRQIDTKLEQLSQPQLQATGWLNLGQVLRKVGKLQKPANATEDEPDAAVEILQKSLVVAQKLANPKLQAAILLELGNTQRALANRAIATNQQDAIQQHQQAATTYYQQAAALPSSMQLQAQLNELSLLVETGQKDQIEPLISTVQSKISDLSATHSSIYAQLNFADSLLQLFSHQSLITSEGDGETGRWGDKEQTTINNQPSTINNSPSPLTSQKDIAAIISRAVQQARQLDDVQAQSYGLGQLGHLYELNQQWQDAQKLTQQAISAIEGIHAPQLRYRWEWQLARLQTDKDDAIAIYQAAIRTLNSVNTDLIYLNSDLQFSFQENVEPLYRELLDLLLPETASNIANNGQLFAAREQIKLLQQTELESFLRCSLQDINLQQVDELIARQGATEAVVYPILLPNRFGILLKFPDSEQLLAYSSPLEEIDIEQLLIQLEEDLRFASKKRAVQRKSQQLYQLLIAPLEEELSKHQIDTLVFFLDAPLRNIPMSVLYDGEKYLIEKYAVAITSGLELLDSPALARGNMQAALAGLSQSRQGYSPLRNVKGQFEQVSSEINSQVILDEEFTVEGLQTLLNSLPFPVVHIATHGQFSSQPEETFLVAWNDKIRVDELRNLLRRRAETRPEPVELLVLAACETSQGDKRAALGLAGVAVNAGARSTLATLWKIIADESPGTLLSQFYRELRDNPDITKAQALRRAQLAFLQDNNRKAPYYWAPYVLIGNWL